MSYKNDPWLLECVQKHNEEREKATKDMMDSGEWRETFEDFCKEVFELALKKHTTEHLLECSKRRDNEDLIFNFFN